MSYPVKLYVYDLSNGLAKSLSLGLTGTYIEGIWHTSVVVYGKEIYFGQGIYMVEPGTTHHGAPLKVVDLGTTELPFEIFFEYLEELKERYTAEKYHLLDFNCNHFSNEVVGFLNGGQIPSYIQSLPSDFLATPFGQMIRPKIDSFFGASRSQNPLPINPLGTVDPTTLLANINPIKTEVSRPDSLESLQKLIKSSAGLVVIVQKPDCALKSATESLLCELTNTYGIGQVKIAVVTSSRELPKHRYEDVQTLVVQFFVNGMEVGRTNNVCPNVLRFEFKNMLHFLSPSESILNLKPHAAKVSLAVTKTPKLPQLIIDKNRFLKAASINGEELGNYWEEVEQDRFSTSEDTTLISKLETILTSVLSLPIDEACLVLDGISYLMCHPKLSTSFASKANTPMILDALAKGFEKQESPKRSIIHFVLSLFSSYSSAELCTSVTYPLDNSNTSPLISLGKISAIALADSELAELGAKLAYSISLNLQIPFLASESSNFFGLEDGEIWAMEVFSPVVSTLTESKDKDLVLLLAEIFVIANAHLALTPSSTILIALAQSLELQSSLEEKITSLELMPKEKDFLEQVISYLNCQF